MVLDMGYLALESCESGRTVSVGERRVPTVRNLLITGGGPRSIHMYPCAVRELLQHQIRVAAVPHARRLPH